MQLHRASIIKIACVVLLIVGVIVAYNYAVSTSDTSTSSKVINGQGTSIDNTFGIEFNYPSPPWYFKDNRLISTEGKDQTPSLMKRGINDNANRLIVWGLGFSDYTKDPKECSSATVPGEFKIITLDSGVKVGECMLSIKESATNEMLDIYFYLRHPVTKEYINFQAYSYSAPISQRKEILKEIETIISNVKFSEQKSPPASKATYLGSGPEYYDFNNAVGVSKLADVQIRAQSYYEANRNTYEGLCNNSGVVKALSDAQVYTGGIMPRCNDSGSVYAVSATLLPQSMGYWSKSAGFWCVDSTGFSGQVSAELDSNTSCK